MKNNNNIKMGIVLFLILLLILVIIAHFFGFQSRLSPYHPPLKWNEIYIMLPLFIKISLSCTLGCLLILYIANRDNENNLKNKK
jgi:hypothetical protein